MAAMAAVHVFAWVLLLEACAFQADAASSCPASRARWIAASAAASAPAEVTSFHAFIAKRRGQAHLKPRAPSLQVNCVRLYAPRSSVCASAAVPLPIRRLNSSSKWLVVAGSFATLGVRHDLAAPYIVIGMVVASFAGKLLKRLLNHQRPLSARAADPGMPSSHALVSAFGANAWALELGTRPAMIGLNAFAIGVSCLRVACGDHSWAQVAVGFWLGVACAHGWMLAARKSGLLALGPGAGGYALARSGLYGMCAVGVYLFALRNRRKFVRSRKSGSSGGGDAGGEAGGLAAH
jgi:dolichyldiphosphatase